MRLQTLSGRNLAPVDSFERFLEMSVEMPQAGISYEHIVAENIYIREMHVKASTVIIGAKHLCETVAILTKGRMRLYTPEGVRLIQAPFTAITPPGSQRIGHALEDCIFVTIHERLGRSVSQIEDAWVGKSEYLLGREKNLQLIRQQQNEEILKSRQELSGGGLLQHVPSD